VPSNKRKAHAHFDRTSLLVDICVRLSGESSDRLKKSRGFWFGKQGTSVSCLLCLPLQVFVRTRPVRLKLDSIGRRGQFPMLVGLKVLV
jgi:hypothetical protein